MDSVTIQMNRDAKQFSTFLLLINVKARIQALFYFIIPPHIPLLWCLYFYALSIQHASHRNVRVNKTIRHEQENDSKSSCSITYTVLPSKSKAK